MSASGSPDSTVAPKAQPLLSVCVVTYKRPQGLARLLTALRPQIDGHTDRELIVVNDGSDDAAYRQVIADFGPAVRYEPMVQNRGVAFARHRSTEVATGEWIVFIDDDCLPPPFWLDWLTAAIEQSPDLDVIVGAVKPLAPVGRNFLATVQIAHGLHPYPERVGDQIRFVTANLALRKSAYAAVGGFRIRADFPNAAEDTELSSHISRSSLARRLDWDWYVHHDVGDGYRVNLRRYWRYGYANGVLHRLTTSPPFHDWQYQVATDKRPLRRILTTFRMRREQAKRSFRSPLVALISALVALSIDEAYVSGVRASQHFRPQR